MKSNPHNNPKVEVPRDAKTDTGRGRPMPPPGGDAIKDEDYAAGHGSLPAGSRAAKALHENPPTAPDQLRAGSAGDSGRPTKSGLHDKALGPRGGWHG